MHLEEFPTNRMLAIVFASLFVLSVLAIVPADVIAQNAGPNEPNDNRSSAARLGGEKLSGVANYTGPNVSKSDHDWYSVDAQKGETVTLLIRKPAMEETGLRISVFPPDSESYEFDYIIAEDGDTREQYTFTAPVSGKYYLRIDKNTGADVAAPYTVSLKNQTGRTNVSSAFNATSGTQQETEPNDDYFAASPIQGTQVRGETMVKGDSDWYSLNATEGENVSFQFIKPADASVVTMELWAPNGTEITNATAFEGVSTATLSATANQTGTYKLYVGSDYSGVNIPYRLYTPASEAPENTSLTATTTESLTQTPTTTETLTQIPTRTPTQTPTRTETTTAGETAPAPSATATTTGSESTETPTEAATSTSEPTETMTEDEDTSTRSESGTDATGTSMGTNTSGESSTFGPGFGPVVAVTALLAAGLLAVRQRG